MPDSAPQFILPPDLDSVRFATADLNGRARGKRMPTDQAAKAMSSGARMPLSTLNVDIWGDDIADSPLVFQSGDADGLLRATGRNPVPMPWLSTRAALLPMWMFAEDGAPYAGDPRQALAAVIGRYAEAGLTPVVATELEFYLVDKSAARPTPPAHPATGRQMHRRDVLSLGGLDQFDAYFTDLYDACREMGIDADAAISESGLGQFEINLLHSEDALKAADDAWLFKQAVKGLARKHDMAATFMAKPYPDHAGNGLHMHFSVLDGDGRNIFDNGSEAGSPRLGHAVAGCLAAMQDMTLLFAPHRNSYRRVTPNSHAPTRICWGYENRTAAIRIPGGPPAARRIEHRVAGGDANAYLVLAGVLGAALTGLEDGAQPPPPITGNAAEQPLERLPFSWEEAIALFAGSETVARVFDPVLIENLVLCKKQEAVRFAERWTEFEYETYLDTV